VLFGVFTGLFAVWLQAVRKIAKAGKTKQVFKKFIVVSVNNLLPNRGKFNL
jgi:hypothetical protein